MRDEYTAVCDRCYRQTFHTAEQPCGMSYPARCGECHQTRHDKQQRCSGTLRMIDRSTLAPQFLPYYGRDVRIKVRTKWGEIGTGTVSRTMGWKPSYMLMPRRDSTGSSFLLGKDDVVVAVKRGDRYVPTGY